MHKSLPQILLLVIALGLGLEILLLIKDDLSSEPAQQATSQTGEAEKTEVSELSKAPAPLPAAATLPSDETAVMAENALKTNDRAAAMQTEGSTIKAQVVAVNFTTISAGMAANISRLPLRDGDRFRRGAELVSFDCASQMAMLNKSKALLAIARRNAESNKRLLDLGYASVIEYENSNSEYERARSELSEAEATISKCKISAPFDGRVLELKARGQQFVQVGQPVMEIIDNRSLEIEFMAPSRLAATFDNSQFEILIDETGHKYPALVKQVGAQIDSVSQTIKVTAYLKGEFPEIKPGMSGTIYLPTGD